MISGIYSIFCTENKKYYVGQAINIETRIKAHINKLKANNHHSPYLQNSFNAYGINCFVFDVLEYCDILELDEKEQIYISKYNSLNPNGFNCTNGGSGMRGFVFTDETKKNWSKSRKGKYMGKEHPKSVKVNGVNIKTGCIVKFDSTLCAERFLGKKGSHKNISSNCRGKRNHAYGYVWSYEN